MASPENSSAKLFRVTPQQADRTLVQLLRGWLGKDTSWGEARKVLAARRVLVNGNLCLDEARRLKPTDVVKLLPYSMAPPPREDDVVIRYLDQHVVVVEKPSGLTSVRHAEERQWSGKRKQRDPTLEDLLPRIIAKKEHAAQKRPQRPGKHVGRTRRPPVPSRSHPVRPVHRLDRDTSGIMVFARTVPAERHLVIQFREHTTERRYLAITHGKLASQTISSFLVRDRGDGRRGSSRTAGAGKRAVTHVKMLEQWGDYTLVECRLETGRTHQIRIHLSEAGHPVCGDKVYGRELFDRRGTDPSGAPRLALHAAELVFVHPVTGRPLKFSMRLPRDLAQFADRLRQGET